MQLRAANKGRNVRGDGRGLLLRQPVRRVRKAHDAERAAHLCRDKGKLRRHVEGRIAHAELHQQIEVSAAAGRVAVSLDIVPDEDNPYATLSAHNEAGELLAEVRVAASFKLSRSSAIAWADSRFKKPA